MEVTLHLNLTHSINSIMQAPEINPLHLQEISILHLQEDRQEDHRVIQECQIVHHFLKALIQDFQDLQALQDHRVFQEDHRDHQGHLHLHLQAQLLEWLLDHRLFHNLKGVGFLHHRGHQAGQLL